MHPDKKSYCAIRTPELCGIALIRSSLYEKNNYPNHRNHETQEWEKVRVLDYTYEKGYPTVVTMAEDDGADQSKTEYEYTFDGDLQ